MAIGLMIFFGMAYITYISSDTRKVVADIDPSTIVTQIHKKYPPLTLDSITHVRWSAYLFPMIHWDKSKHWVDIHNIHDSVRINLSDINKLTTNQKLFMQHWVWQSQLLFGLFTFPNDVTQFTIVPSEPGTIAIMVQAKNHWIDIDQKVIYTLDNKYQLLNIKFWNPLLNHGYAEAKVKHDVIINNQLINNYYDGNGDTIIFINFEMNPLSRIH